MIVLTKGQNGCYVPRSVAVHESRLNIYTFAFELRDGWSLIETQGEFEIREKALRVLGSLFDVLLRVEINFN